MKGAEEKEDALTLGSAFKSSLAFAAALVASPLHKVAHQVLHFILLILIVWLLRGGIIVMELLFCYQQKVVYNLMDLPVEHGIGNAHWDVEALQVSLFGIGGFEHLFQVFHR